MSLVGGYTTFTRQIGLKNTLINIINVFLSSSTGIPVILDFLDGPWNSAVNPGSGNPWGQDRYNSSVGFLNQWVLLLSSAISTNPALSGNFYRLVCTLPDGTVWYDSSSSKNTYADFLTNTVNTSNHNTRSAYLQAILNENGIGFEEKTAKTATFGGAQTSVVVRESRVVIRVGSNSSYIVSNFGLSYNASVIQNTIP